MEVATVEETVTVKYPSKQGIHSIFSLEHIRSLDKCFLALPIVFSVFHKHLECIKLGYMFTFSSLCLTNA